MKNLTSISVFALSVTFAAPALSSIEIDFEDIVIGDSRVLSNRYESLGVTFNSIANPYPILGPFPSPETLPETIGDVYVGGLAVGTGFSYVAISTGNNVIEGDNGILISFDFDVSSLSLQGVDGGYFYGIPSIRDEDEAVTLSAYDQHGKKIGFTYSTFNIYSEQDITPASIDFPNMRYVAFNYTGNSYGFYAIDNLSFTPAVPEPSGALLFTVGLAVLTLSNRKTFKSDLG